MRLPLPNATLLKHCLRMDNAHWLGYLLRLLLLATALLILIGVHISSSFNAAARAPGLDFFVGLAVVNIVFIMLFAISFFATAITEEKEASSLGLLLMTGISPSSLLLGKATGKLVSGAMLLAVQIPFAALAVALGGVGLFQIFATYIALFGYMCLLCGAALLCSTVCRSGSAAGSLTLVFIAATLFLGSKYGSWLGFLTPFGGNILSPGFAGPLVAMDFLYDVLAGAGLFLLARLLFDPFSRERQPRNPLLKRLADINLFGAVPRFFAGRSWREAICWKEFHYVFGGWPFFALNWLWLLGALPLSYWIMLRFDETFTPESWRDAAPGILLGAGLLTFIAESIYVAGSVFGNEVWSKTLQDLAALPGGLRGAVVQKFKAALLMLSPASLCLAAGLVAVLCFNKPKIELNFALFIISFAAEFVMALFITALMSMLLKHGAVIVSLLLTFALQMAFSLSATLFVFAASAFLEKFLPGFYGKWDHVLAIFGIPCALSVAVCVGLGFLIAWRLRASVEKSCA